MSGKIYTRGGDGGTTSLVDGTRVPKYDLRVEAYGTIDEANSAIGLVRTALEVAVDDEADLDRILDFAQHRLFNCSSRLATPGGAIGPHTPRVDADDVTTLERFIDLLTDATGGLEHFVLPGGCEQAARLHVARTVVRRAERAVAHLASVESVEPEVLTFLNRLSDLLFAASRYANMVYQGGDVFWNPEL